MSIETLKTIQSDSPGGTVVGGSVVGGTNTKTFKERNVQFCQEENWIKI